MTFNEMLEAGTLDDLHDELDILYFEFTKNPYVSETKMETLDKIINMFWGTKYPEMDWIFLTELETYRQ